MNRRTYLNLFLVSLFAGKLSGRQRRLPQGRERERIVIVGAGVSALGAAERLRDAGFQNITLLEARDRIGGRVWTSDVWANAPVDLGASWIHGWRGNPITKMARQVGAKTQLTDWDNLQSFEADG